MERLYVLGPNVTLPTVHGILAVELLDPAMTAVVTKPSFTGYQGIGNLGQRFLPFIAAR